MIEPTCECQLPVKAEWGRFGGFSPNTVSLRPPLPTYFFGGSRDSDSGDHLPRLIHVKIDGILTVVVRRVGALVELGFLHESQDRDERGVILTGAEQLSVLVLPRAGSDRVVLQLHQITSP